MQLDEFSDLVGSIYDAILLPATWPGVVKRICQGLDGHAASIHLFDALDGHTRIFVDYNGDPAYLALAAARYSQMNPIGAALLLADLDEPVRAFDMVDEAEFVETVFYKEWCVPQKYYDLMGAIIAKRPREVGAISAVRLIDQPRFGDADRNLLRLIAPHVRRAVTLTALLEQNTVERNNLAGVIDKLAAAVIMVDGGANVLRANLVAAKSLAEGTVARIREGGLSLVDPVADRLLRAALQNLSREPQFVPVDAGAHGKFVVAVLPIDSESGVHALFLQPHESEPPPVARHIAGMFGLTPREVTVLMPMLQGKSLAEISENLGISVVTARSHLDRLFKKTGTGRQAELVQRVLSALPPVRLG